MLYEVITCSFIAMEAGADFIKTSTGKAGTGATPEAVWVMTSAVADFYYLTGSRITSYNVCYTKLLRVPLWARTLLVKGIILNTRPKASAAAYSYNFV